MRAIACLVVICALSVAPAVAGTDPKPSEGRLVTRDKATLVDVPLEHTDVTIRVDGPVAHATVTQRFKNPYARKIEAVYLFPLPTGAAVHDLAIATGARRIRGQLQERGKAKVVYQAARKQGHVAALLEQERPNLFTQSVANLEPGATVDVTLEYVQRLDYEDGGYSLVFPMVAGPRFVPQGSKAQGSAAAVQPQVLPPGMRSSHDVALRVELDAGVALEGLASPSHQLAIQRPAPSRATITLSPGDTIPNKDFVLTYKVAGTVPKLAVLPHRAGGAGSFLLVAQPPATAEPAAIAPREIVFVLDTSSSMRGAPLAKAKELIRHVLWTLRPDDTFQIVRFSDAASPLAPGPIAAKPKNLEATLAWLAALEAGGGTEVIRGIDAALAVPHDPLRLRIVAFVTDGYVGNEDEILAKLGKHVADSRLFAFGIGSAVNRYLLEEMASVGRGAVQFVRPDEDTTRAVTAFARRIDAPVLTDLRVDWNGLAVTDVTPAALPDLFVGQPLVLAGRYTAGGSRTITVRGTQAGRAVRFDVPVVLPDRDAARPAIATLWARARITELSRQLVRKADPAVERQILALSLAHRVLTPFTAFVAVDESRVTQGTADRVVVPVAVPEYVQRIPTGDATGGIGYGSIGYGSGYGASGASGSFVASRGVGTLSASPPRSLPTITLASPVVFGSLDASIIRRYIQRQKQKLQYCYEKELLGKPTLAGTVKVELVIAATGLVADVKASGLGNAAVESCFASVVRAIEFPATPDGGVIRVTYPFTLRTP